MPKKDGTCNKNKLKKVCYWSLDGVNCMHARVSVCARVCVRVCVHGACVNKMRSITNRTKLLVQYFCDRMSFQKYADNHNELL